MQQPHVRRPSLQYLFVLAWLVPAGCKVNESGVSGVPANVERPGAGGQGGSGPRARDAARPLDGPPVEAGSPGSSASDALTSVDVAAAADSAASDASTSPADAQPPPDASIAPAETAAPVRPARCDSPLALPVPVRRIAGAGARSDDFTFDRDGHLVSFADTSLVRVSSTGDVERLAANVIGARGGALRALPGGELMVADFERDAVLLMSTSGQVRRLATAVRNPMKMVRGPAGQLYVTGKQGTISRVSEVDGTVTAAATTTFELGGLAFSPNHRTLYVGAISTDNIQRFEVRSDLTLGPPQLVRAQIPRAQALASDECGNLYVVSEGDARIRRIKEGGAVEVVAELGGSYPWSLSFGSGQQGWSATSLYVQEPGAGRLFELPVGVAGSGPPPARSE